MSDNPILGAFDASPHQSAISTVAQIFLRTIPFTKTLKHNFLRKFPESELLAKWFQLYEQLAYKPDTVNIARFIGPDQRGPLVRIDIAGCLLKTITLFDKTFNPDNDFTDIFISHSEEQKHYMTDIAPGESVDDAFDRLRDSFPPRAQFKKSTVLFFSGSTNNIPDRLRWGYNCNYDHYVVVCDAGETYDLYLRDPYGWLKITDKEIVEVDTFSKENVKIVGYINDGTSVEAIRLRLQRTRPILPAVATRKFTVNKRYTFVKKTLDPVFMRFKTDEIAYTTMEECLSDVQAAVSELERTYGKLLRIRFRRDDDPSLSCTPPNPFMRSVTVYVEITDKPYSLIPVFWRVDSPIDLDITCYPIKRLSVNITFARDQNGGEIFQFCERFVGEILMADNSRIRVFHGSGDAWVELDIHSTITVAQIKFAGHSIVFSIDGKDPRNKDVKPIPRADKVKVVDREIKPVMVVEHREHKQRAPKEKIEKEVEEVVIESPKTVTIKIIDLQGDVVRESFHEIPHTRGLVGADVIKNTVHNTPRDQLGLYAVSKDKMSLVPLGDDTTIEAWMSPIHVMWLARKRYVNVVLLTNEKPMVPTGRIYKIPVSSTESKIAFHEKSPLCPRDKISAFLGIPIGSVGGIVKTGRQIGMGSYSTYLISDFQCLYAVISADNQ